tara:strand:- start:222 stop:635 length:414 start_codon:yes stop_codon:yes gene_type:complete
MDKLKGIIFLLESLFKSSKKQMLSNKLLVDPDEAYSIIKKLNDAVSEIEHQNESMSDHFYQAANVQMTDTELLDTKKEMLRLKQDANEYADGILSRLQLLATKLQKNVIKIEKNIAEGRKLIEQKQLSQTKGETYET